jgi:ammonium transporter, Amt family
MRSQRLYPKLVVCLCLIAVFLPADAYAQAGTYGSTGRDIDRGGIVAGILMLVQLGMAVAIVAVAGRVRPAIHVVSTLLLAVLIYPAYVFLAWKNPLLHDPAAFLALLNFVDFAGATTVGTTAGWVALAAHMATRPIRRTQPVDHPNAYVLNGGRVPFAAAAPILGLGWVAVIAGSAFVGGNDLGPIVVNIVLAAGMGACIGSCMGFYQGRIGVAQKAGIGMLGGLVAVAAGCHLLGPTAALVVGAVGSAAAILGNAFVLRSLKVDDPLGLIGIHAFGGVAGTLLLSLLASVGSLPAGGRLTQLWVQAVAAGINFYWAFGASYLFFRVFDRLTLGRAGASGKPGLRQVEDALAELLESGADIGRRLPVMAGGRAGRLTVLLNRLLDKVETESRLGANLVTHQHEEAERVAALAKATFEAIMIHRNGIVVDGNEELAKLVGRPLSDLIGRSIFEFLRDGQTIRVSEIIKLNDDARHEISIAVANGEDIPVAARGRDIIFRGEKARVGCFVDLRERRQAENRIRYLAQHDPLTGLPNRVLFTESLCDMMQRAESPHGCGVVVIDLDRFKDINDIHGHQAGDTVILEVSARLSAVAGPHDIVARLGGDEFAAILGAVSTAEELEAFGSRVLACMAAPIDIRPGEQVNVTVSAGAALFPDHSTDGDGLVGCADVALHHAKTSGRNAFRIFRKGMNDLIEKRRALEGDLEVALQRGEFELYLQPRVSAHQASITGYEALLRWNHPERGMVSPADFIPVAEASGKIIQLGEWVLTEAVRLLDGIEGHISVNVSPLQFRHTDFVANLAGLLARSGADPRRIELEITESVLIDDDRRAVQILSDLKRMGFAIALDDFGTGYSSLSYLSRYPFDTIKIDRSFVSNLGSADTNQMIVKTIIDLGTGLGMKVVAEGVETIEEALFLGQAGCHELQGYLLGRPVKVADIATKVDPDIARQLRTMPPKFLEMRDKGFAGYDLPRRLGALA